MTRNAYRLATRKLGSQGLEVAEIGLGTMGTTVAYGAADEEGGVAAIRRAYESGVTMIDTAEMYGAGEGERIVGRAIKGFRDELVLATKFGYDFRDPARTPISYDSRPSRIREVVENSLRHLGTDHIDVLYQHRVDPAVPGEEVAQAVGELIRAGKVRYFGLSEAGPNTIRRAHAVQPVSVLQTEYSLFERTVEQAVLPTVRELGIGFVAYSPLGRGFLTAELRPASAYPADDMRSFDPRWQPGNYEKNVAAVRELDRLAREKGITVPQLALAWLLARGDDIVPIPGTRRPERVDENLGAASVRLSPEELEHLDDLLPDGAAGARYLDIVLPTWD
jgi:aryl-alcohol dehydrogenase-like predicted oxidoreductase